MIKLSVANFGFIRFVWPCFDESDDIYVTCYGVSLKCPSNFRQPLWLLPFISLFLLPFRTTHTIVLLPSELQASKTGHVFPYAAFTSRSRLLFSLWTDPLWSWCYGLEKFNCWGWWVVLSAVHKVFGWPQFPQTIGRIFPKRPPSRGASCSDGHCE